MTLQLKLTDSVTYSFQFQEYAVAMSIMIVV